MRHRRLSSHYRCHRNCFTTEVKTRVIQPPWIYRHLCTDVDASSVKFMRNRGEIVYGNDCSTFPERQPARIYEILNFTWRINRRPPLGRNRATWTTNPPIKLRELSCVPNLELPETRNDQLLQKRKRKKKQGMYPVHEHQKTYSIIVGRCQKNLN